MTDMGRQRGITFCFMLLGFWMEQCQELNLDMFILIWIADIR